MTTSIILPSNGRPVQVLAPTASRRGSSGVEVVAENDAIALTLYVDSIQSNTILDIDVLLIGNNSRNSKIIYSFPQVQAARQDQLSIVLPANGRMKIVANYTGSATFELSGKAVSATTLMLQDPSKFELSLTNDDKMYRSLMISSLHQINETLNIILNHQREITGLEKDKGDKY